MLRSLLIVVAVICLVVLGVLAVAAAKPARFTVTRSVFIQAQPERVFGFINDLRAWPEWSVDTRDDPNIKRTYSGEIAGQGAVCVWDSAGKSGKVRLEIVESTPAMVKVQADWERPFVARNINIFTIERQGTGTQVTWTLDGQNVFLLKVMTVFTSADKLMGIHLDTNLIGLKIAAERQSNIEF